MAANASSFQLTQEQRDHFLKYGYVKIPGCFSREKAAEWCKDVWVRLGYSPTDKSTWKDERINMPAHKFEPVQTFAPKAWAAICELLGGEDRTIPNSAVWSDGLILNMGLPDQDDSWPDPKDLQHWHVDGADFTHYLDSPELSLLVLPLLSDVKEHAGGTMVCCDAIPAIAEHLYKHPEGVTGGMLPRNDPNGIEGQQFYGPVVKQCKEFHEMTGNVGDVLLLHPFMCHSQTKNLLRVPRIIINAFVSLKEPFNLDRDDPSKYSLVEQKTLSALNTDRLRGWRITAQRENVKTGREESIAAAKELETQRLMSANRAAAVA